VLEVYHWISMSEPIKLETLKEKGITNAFYLVVAGAGRFE